MESNMPKQNTPMLPGFQYETRGRKRLSFVKHESRLLKQIKHLKLTEFSLFFADIFNCASLLECNKSGAYSRRRTYTQSIVFWSFMMQVMSSSMACQEVVVMVKCWLKKMGNKINISCCNSAYVKARNKFSLSIIYRIFIHTRDRILSVNKEKLLWKGHHIKVVDGTGLSMPDTQINQDKWPQSRSQKEGCGFPYMNLCGVFCLATGAILNWRIGNKHISERNLWQKLWKTLNPGDLILGDRGFCGFGMLAKLKMQDCDQIIRLKENLKWQRISTKIAKNQWYINWEKPKSKSKLMSAEEWSELPDVLQLRVMKCRIYEKGFRSHEIIVITTLLDVEKYTIEDIARLYQKRWDIELNFRHIKTTMGMDILSSKSPEAIKKEIAMYMISYNLVRSKMIATATAHNHDLERISFTLTLKSLTRIDMLLINANTPEIKNLQSELLDQISTKLIPKRNKERIEPRAVKRRRKRGTRMSRPRAVMRQEVMDKIELKNTI